MDILEVVECFFFQDNTGSDCSLLSLCVLQFNFVGKLLGPRGNSLKRLQEDTLTKMSILGKGSMRDKEKVKPHSLLPVFVCSPFSFHSFAHSSFHLPLLHAPRQGGRI